MDVLNGDKHPEKYLAVANVNWSNGEQNKILIFVSVYLKYLSLSIFI